MRLIDDMGAYRWTVASIVSASIAVGAYFDPIAGLATFSGLSAVMAVLCFWLDNE